jgi:hypothetical protein
MSNSALTSALTGWRWALVASVAVLGAGALGGIGATLGPTGAAIGVVVGLLAAPVLERRT